MATLATHTSVNVNATITSALSSSPLDTFNTYYYTLVYKTWGLNSINHLAAISLLVFLAHALHLHLQTNPYQSVPLINKAYWFPSTLWLVYVLPLGWSFLFILALLSTVLWWSLMTLHAKQSFQSNKTLRKPSGVLTTYQGLFFQKTSKKEFEFDLGWHDRKKTL